MRFVSGGAGAGAIVIGLALTLAGCVGDPAPIVTRTPSGGPVVVESPDATPSPTPTALSNDELFAMMPEGADRDDLYGAMVTAQFFLEQYSVMFQTGDTRVWEALSDPGCGYCADALANAERVRDEGWVAEGGDITVDESQTRAALDEADTASVLVTASVSEYVVWDEAEAIDLQGAVSGYEFGLVMQRGAGGWIVAAVVGEELAL
ncbi:DUF6318 family protein [Demequina sp. SYSU T00039]|uniref:DUF6318 family protein n=1 Tax=Demequina lignilytica TaxID=3051663 RepID=A0AAW7M7B6_9MICO|nr:MULTISPECIES: DUF6318 family protein [unclassified Demequina]MDN4477255.1 DUF6318 family protein [Demequina sp. SYSU T00039-1]MDN4487428.1 DUF6318 family protein [Demequina sp. SYSU T00039]